jgi:hypothetical protein
MVSTNINFTRGLLMKPEDFAPTPENMTAMFNAMTLMMVGLIQHMTPAQRAGFTEHLASMGRLAESKGDTATETLLIDLHQSSRI